MLVTTYVLILLFAAIFYFGIKPVVFPPSNFPKNIPTIPFYVSFLGSYSSLDQEQIYKIYLRDKLQKYGAAKIYFASRWNILVTRPSYLKQVLKEDEFAKSGNQIKIPKSVLSEYTGDNVISANGDSWKLYREVLTNAIQFPNLKPISVNAIEFVQFIRNQIKITGSNSLVVADAIQRLTLQNIMDSLFGINFKLFQDSNPRINERLRYVKSQIFRPLFLNFPLLDSLPIPSRIRARAAVKEFRSYFCSMVKECPVDEQTVGSRLVKALKYHVLTEKQFEDNAMIVMIAGHENPQLLLNSLLYVLSKHSEVQDTLREEIMQNGDSDSNYYLHAVIYETLRMYPPLGQIINRCTTKDVWLGGTIKIPKGTYVGYNNLVTGRDTTAWENPETFSPTRWGNSMKDVSRNYNLAKSNATMSAFHGRKRACLGEKFALNQMKQTLTQLLINYKVELDPNWRDKLTPGGPVSPLQLKVVFTQLRE